MKKILKIVIVGVIVVSGGIFFNVSKTEADTCFANGSAQYNCTPSHITVDKVDSTSSTITVSGSVTGGYYVANVNCDTNLGGFIQPQSIAITFSAGDPVNYSVDKVKNGTTPVTITQQAQYSTENHCTSFVSEQGTYSFSVSNPYPTLSPCGSVSFLDASPVSFGSCASMLNAAPVSDNIPTSFNMSETKTVGTDSNPLNIVMKNTGATTWTSDSKSAVASSASGTCQADTDGDGIKDAPSETSANDGSSCTVKYNYSSSQFKLQHTASQFSLTPESVSYLKAVNITQTLSYTPPTQDCGSLDNSLNFNYNEILNWLTPTAFAITGSRCITRPASYYYSTSYDVSPDIAPSSVATFNISSMKAPATSGTYTETWKMANSGATFGTPFIKTIIVGIADLNMKGILSATSCTIPVGASSCTSNLTWSITTTQQGTSSVTSAYPNANTTVATGNTGTNVPISIPYVSSPQTFYLYNSSSSINPLAQSTATATCVSGTGWNGSSCASGYGSGNSSTVNGVCGTANKANYSNGTSSYGSSDTQCSLGTSNNLSFPAAGGVAYWTCQGSGGGTDSSICSASQASSATSGGGSQSGYCGTTHYTCNPSTNSSTDNLSGVSAWTWNCPNATNGCSELKKKPTYKEN